MGWTTSSCSFRGTCGSCSSGHKHVCHPRDDRTFAMKLLPNWIRDFVDLTVEDHRLAEDLTDVGLGVEGICGSGADTIFEMEIGTNRPDAMNHYGVAREAAAIYDLPLKPLAPKLPSASNAGPFPVTVQEP